MPPPQPHLTNLSFSFFAYKIRPIIRRVKHIVSAQLGSPCTAEQAAHNYTQCSWSFLLFLLRNLPSLAPTVEWKLGRKPSPQPRPVLFTLFSPCLYVLFLGTDPEETILHAFKVFDTEGKGFAKADL